MERDVIIRRRIQSITGRQRKLYDQLTYSGKWRRDHPQSNLVVMERQRARKSTPEGRAAARAHHLKSQYGITVHEFNALYRTCGGVCPGCRRTMKLDAHRGDNRSACVDHDHHSGAVRGLLCRRCNVAVGMMNDDLQIAINLAAYLGSAVS